MYFDVRFVAVDKRDAEKFNYTTTKCYTSFLKGTCTQIVTSYLFSFRYFVHPPGVPSTARYRTLLDKMCL